MEASEKVLKAGASSVSTVRNRSWVFAVLIPQCSELIRRQLKAPFFDFLHIVGQQQTIMPQGSCDRHVCNDKATSGVRKLTVKKIAPTARLIRIWAL
jgi:hypothetical protein